MFSLLFGLCVFVRLLFFLSSFWAIYFDSSLSLSLSLEFQSLFISQKHASYFFILTLTMLLTTHKVKSLPRCQLFRSVLIIFFFWFYFFFRLSSFVVLFVQLILRLMCTKSVIRVVWASNQRKSTENKQMICVSRSLACDICKIEFHRYTERKPYQWDTNSDFKRERKYFIGYVCKWWLKECTFLNCCRTATTILACDCQIDGWFLHWLPSQFACTYHPLSISHSSSRTHCHHSLLLACS